MKIKNPSATKALIAHNKLSKELENTLFESEVNWLVLTVNWKGNLEKVDFEKKEIIWDEKKLAKAIKEAWNKVNIHVTNLQKEKYDELTKSLKIEDKK